MIRLFRRIIESSPWAAFALLAISFAGFSLFTLETFQMVNANLDYIRRDGAMALLEGGALQLASLCGSILLALVFYMVFKACERVLVYHLTGR